ncbi:MAG: hypothetical protein KGM42_20920 [Hyphomicrobiales bacterium]|nr:hypothetical protein [Hyphomicrobiales bacterium]
MRIVFGVMRAFDFRQILDGSFDCVDVRCWNRDLNRIVEARAKHNVFVKPSRCF